MDIRDIMVSPEEIRRRSEGAVMWKKEYQDAIDAIKDKGHLESEKRFMQLTEKFAGDFIKRRKSKSTL